MSDAGAEKQAVAAWDTIAIGQTAFRRQAIGIGRTRLEFAGFFSGHCEICNHAPNMAAP